MMDEQRALEVLLPDVIYEGGLYDSVLRVGHHRSIRIEWEKGEKAVKLNGQFSADELEAIAWFMRNFR